jgi:hypothetical protein
VSQRGPDIGPPFGSIVSFSRIVSFDATLGLKRDFVYLNLLNNR